MSYCSHDRDPSLFRECRKRCSFSRGLPSADCLYSRSAIMSSITDTANAFFAACEKGKGWEGCGSYCAPDATFTGQAEPLSGIKTLQEYTEWMKGLLTTLTDGKYEVISFATDAERNNVCAYGMFTGTHLAK